MTFATGAPPEEMDRPEMERILREARGEGLRPLVHAGIQSRRFRER